MIKKETSIYENLLLNFPINKKEVAFTYEFKKFSYKHMLDLINTFSFNLKKKGIKKGDIVTLCLVNIPSTVYLLFAINQIGAKANLIHPLMQKEMILKSMKQLNSSFLFVLENRFNELNSLTKENICITYLDTIEIEDDCKNIHAEVLEYVAENYEVYCNLYTWLIVNY